MHDVLFMMQLKCIQHHLYLLISTIDSSRAPLNPCAAEIKISIFHSFEAGNAYAISSFK